MLWPRTFSNEGMNWLGMEYDRKVWTKINVENKGVWQEMAEEWFQIKWQRTGIFKSEDSSPAPAPLRPKYVRYCHSHQVGDVKPLITLKLCLKVKSQSNIEKYANRSGGSG